MHEVFVPVVAVYGLFNLISRDELKFKADTFFPLMSSFYTVYMPYFIISNHPTSFSFFELFAEPVIFLCMILSLSLLIKIAVNPKRSLLKSLICTAVSIAVILIPPLLQITFVYNLTNFLLILIFSIYILFPPAIALFHLKFKNTF